MRTGIRFALVLLAAVFVGAFVWGLLSIPSASDWIGKPAPPTQGIDADGTTFQLSDSLGKVVLLDFWGNW
jgi:cytochrome oxidase Cu insertion factor (SCO1/SenC/PrrC family)